MVANFMDDDPNLDRNLQRIERAFGEAVIAFPALHDPNLIVVGLKGAPAGFSWADLRQRAAALEKAHGLPFGRYVERLRRMNRCSASALELRD